MPFDGASHPIKTLSHANCVVDRIYDQENVDTDFINAFNLLIPAVVKANRGIDIQAPSTGDMVLLMKSEMITAAKQAFQQVYGVESLTTEFNDNPELLLKRVLGQHKTEAGGALANTTYTQEKIALNGQKPYDMEVLMTLAEGSDGDVVKQSYSEETFQDDIRYGGALTCHVVQYNGNRTMYTVVDDTKPTDDYDLSSHAFDKLKSGEFDQYQVEGFAFENPNKDKLASKLLEAIEIGNARRAEKGLEPIHVVIGASAQFVCEHNQAFKSFVHDIINISPVSIHANTGEFRRLFDMDKQWREYWNAFFEGLEGKKLQEAKDSSPEYRQAKTEANLAAIQYVMDNYGVPYEKERDRNHFEMIITDGGDTGYGVSNDEFFEFKPPKISGKIISSVGAGDNFMGAARALRDFGFDLQSSMYAGAAMASHVLQQFAARPEYDDTPSRAFGIEGPAVILHNANVLPAFAYKDVLETNPYGYPQP